MLIYSLLNYLCLNGNASGDCFTCDVAQPCCNEAPLARFDSGANPSRLRLEIITSRQYKYLMHQLTERGWRLQEPNNLAVPIENRERFGKLQRLFMATLLIIPSWQGT